MSTGTQVYHKVLRMNLIIGQIDAKGRAVCINPKVYDNNQFQVLTADLNDLVKGWQTTYN